MLAFEREGDPKLTGTRRALHGTATPRKPLSTTFVARSTITSRCNQVPTRPFSRSGTATEEVDPLRQCWRICDVAALSRISRANCRRSPWADRSICFMRTFCAGRTAAKACRRGMEVSGVDAHAIWDNAGAQADTTLRTIRTLPRTSSRHSYFARLNQEGQQEE